MAAQARTITATVMEIVDRRHRTNNVNYITLNVRNLYVMLL